jgi:hypothetical protein
MERNTPGADLSSTSRCCLPRVTQDLRWSQSRGEPQPQPLPERVTPVPVTYRLFFPCGWERVVVPENADGTRGQLAFYFGLVAAYQIINVRG